MRPKCVFATVAALMASAGVVGVAGAAPGSDASDVIVVPAPDAAALLAEDVDREARGLAPRFAVREAVNLTPWNSGEWREIDDAYSAWTLRVTSRGVENLNFGFTRYELPAFASLHIAATDGSKEIRPFTDADNNRHDELWTPVLPTDDVTIELIVPTELAKKVDLQLGYVNVGYRPFGAPLAAANRSGSCNVDVVCPEGDDWQDEIDSVGVISTGGATFCTGFMVNNVRQDRRPLFMTAFHCGVRSSDAPSLVVYWNFQNSTCRPPGSSSSGGAGDGTLDQFSTGSTLLADGSASDFTLVELNSSPDESYEVSFSGWDARFYEPSGAVAIHHPSTDEKRISFEFDQTASVVGLTSSPEVPVDQSTHVKVRDWDVGTTEPGSSGSPLYDIDTKRVVGQLHGGAASCSSQTYDAYGRIAYSWDNGSPSNSLRPHLDPDDTGTVFVDTLPAAGAVLTPAGDFASFGVVGGPFSEDSVTYTLENTSPDAIDYEVEFVAGGDLPLLLNGGSGPLIGTLGQGGTLNFTVSLDASAGSLAAGEYSTQLEVRDLTNNASVLRNHTLEVGLTGSDIAPEGGLLAGGPVGGPFDATRTYTVTSTRPTAVTWEVTASQPWVSINGGSSAQFTLSGVGQTADVTIGFNSQADSLPAGLRTATVTFDNVTDDRNETTREVTLDVGRFRYAADDVPQPITDNSAISSAIFVPDNVCIADVNVVVDITHTYIGDLIIELESPSGKVVRLHDRTGGGDNDLMVTYDTGAFNPDGPGALTDYDGDLAQGLWTLTVSDNAGADEGALNNWELQVAAAGTVCPPVANDVAATTGANEATTILLDGASQIGGSLTYVVTSLPSNGGLYLPGTTTEITSAPATLPGDEVVYLPDAGFGGADTFTYSVDDGQPSLVNGTVSVSVVSGDAIYSFPLDVAAGFSTTGAWAFGQPAGNDGDPSSGFSGSNVYGYNLNGAYPNGMGEEYLTTPALDFTNVTGVTLRFQRWLGVERSIFDFARVQVSNDGSSWQTVWTNPSDSTLQDTSWVEREFDISGVADNEATVRVRWVMGSTDGSVTFGGWNVDDIVFTGVSPTCEADVTGDGLVNADDLLAVLGEFGSSVLPNQGGDANGDGAVNADDLLLVLGAFGAPCG